MHRRRPNTSIILNASRCCHDIGPPLEYQSIPLLNKVERSRCPVPPASPQQQQQQQKDPELKCIDAFAEQNVSFFCPRLTNKQTRVSVVCLKDLNAANPRQESSIDQRVAVFTIVY